MSVAELPIYVVSVTTFEDRHRHMNTQAKKYGLNLEYIWNFDADVLTEIDMARVKEDALPRPSVSALLKHLEAQTRQVGREHPICLVLEDDAILFDGFVEKLERTLQLAKALDPGWLIFLGGADNRIDARFLESNELRLIEKPISTAEAYLLDLAGCRRRLAWLEDNLIDLPADHLLKTIDDRLGIRHYWVSEPLAIQGSITGRFRTALDSSRGKHSRVYLMMRYWYNRLRKQIVPRIFKSLLVLNLLPFL
ncbi:glycosyltransferase family 25 protein [Shewanella sp.]|uniref:glycosyltransferase family 25 protein n=1 Tax=Shewanella sp. TaxID=50422 RepID=UPI004047C8A8